MSLWNDKAKQTSFPHLEFFWRLSSKSPSIGPSITNASEPTRSQSQPASLLLWSSPSSHVVLFLPSAPGLLWDDGAMVTAPSDDWTASSWYGKLHKFSHLVCPGVAIQVLGHVFAIGSGMTSSMVWKRIKKNRLDHDPHCQVIRRNRLLWRQNLLSINQEKLGVLTMKSFQPPSTDRYQYVNPTGCTSFFALVVYPI